MLVDSDVLIWYLRGLPKATQILDALPAIRLSDALIAATALEHDLSLATANDKYHRIVKGLRTEVFRPD